MMPKLRQHTRSYYDWNELVEAVNIKSGRDIEDWFGRYKNQPTGDDYKTGNFPMAKWAIEQGFDWQTLNDPVDKAGMAERVRINNAWSDRPDKPEEIRYCGFWCYAQDIIFFDAYNGSTHYFNPSESLAAVMDLDTDGQSQEWVRDILLAFIEVFKENNMPDEIQVEISW